MDFLVVPGNHDTRFIEQQMSSVDWLVYSQSLADERIVGACASLELSPKYNGPELRYVPVIDDNYEDENESQLYKDWHDKKIDLMVTHAGGNWSDSRPRRGGKGITMLGEENGFVCYEGHEHGGHVYRDPVSNVLVIRPGTNHIAKVWRRGKDVIRIEMYRIRGKAPELDPQMN